MSTSVETIETLREENERLRARACEYEAKAFAFDLLSARDAEAHAYVREHLAATSLGGGNVWHQILADAKRLRAGGR